MKTSTIISHLALLVIGGLAGFLIGRSSGNAPELKSQSPAVAGTTDATAEAASEADPDTASIAEELPAAIPVAHAPDADQCFAGEEMLGYQLSLFAEELEGKGLWYDNEHPELFQNNSGIFHRVSDFVRSKCDRYAYPPKDLRGPARLAGWYAGREQLTVFRNREDVIARRNMIRPGSILFFGKGGQNYNDLTPEKAVVDNEGKIIVHMGVVTAVTRDERNDVKGYVMLHGRGDGKIAQRTHYHNLAPAGFGMPPLGNYDQQLVAVANLRVPVTPGGAEENTELTALPTAIQPVRSITKAPDEEALACFGFDFDKFFYNDVAKVLEQQKIGYKIGQHADCSGIVFRVCNKVSEQMEGGCAGSLKLPCEGGYRDSRKLAKWYYDNENLQVVTDPKKMGNMIKVGSVMFFGQNNHKYNKRITIDELAGGPKPIQHVGVVAKVDYDENGNVISYHLFHGHGRPGTPADITKPSIKKNQSKRNDALAFSYWNQQWVAIAPNILTLH